MAETYGGSSGSPMLREYNNELIVVGLHRGDLGGQGHTYVNVATLITVILDDIRMVEYDDSKSEWHALTVFSRINFHSICYLMRYINSIGLTLLP